MVNVAIRALELEYLVKILNWGRGRSQYIFSNSSSIALVCSAECVIKQTEKLLHFLHSQFCYITVSDLLFQSL
jgi:hypothetical protein